MLYLTTITPGTLSILEELFSINELNNFSLVRGTALSLMYGHRLSVDIDLFSFSEFDKNSVLTALVSKFGDRFHYETTNSFGVFGYIDGIKTDFVPYIHPIIQHSQLQSFIRICSPEDIAAMKIQAILGRGQKKDFYDIAELLKHFELKKIIEFHYAKFPSQSLMISIPQALCYFDDAEDSETPISLNELSWEDVKIIISKAVRDFLINE